MLGTCLGRSPEFENLGESDPRAFELYSLRDLETIGRLIEECRYRFIVFKPLKDSDRTAQLLSLHAGGKAVWAFRNYLDRINSAVRQFGRHPLDVFEAFQNGDNSRWQLRGISDRTAQILRNLDLAALSENDGAALMWWVRNSLFFDLSLQDNPRVRLWSYDQFVTSSESELRVLLAFFGAEYHEFMLKGVHRRSVRRDPPPMIDERILGLCQALYDRLESVMRSQSERN